MRLWMAILAWLAATPGFGGEVKFVEVFRSGAGGYHTYRIPAVVVATNGAVLAFAEGRRDGPGDTGRIDLLLKRSTNGGATWADHVVVQEGGADVFGNPAPVVDQTTGAIFLLLTWNRGADTEKAIMAGTSQDSRRVFIMESRDNGSTWSKARDITKLVKRDHWRWYATGPCNGIQTRDGRLVIPANHSDHSDPAKHPYRSHVIYSDDHGATWKLGGVHEDRTNESTVAELPNGQLLQNMRSYHGKNARAIATSTDGGLSWSPLTLDTNLIDAVCQASLLRVGDVLLFSNPASVKRENMTVKLSRDWGKTWTIAERLHAGPSAYSCLAALKDGTVLCLFERGEKSPYERISLARFQLNNR